MSFNTTEPLPSSPPDTSFMRRLSGLVLRNSPTKKLSFLNRKNSTPSSTTLARTSPYSISEPQLVSGFPFAQPQWSRSDPSQSPKSQYQNNIRYRTTTKSNQRQYQPQHEPPVSRSDFIARLDCSLDSPSRPDFFTKLDLVQDPPSRPSVTSRRSFSSILKDHANGTMGGKLLQDAFVPRLVEPPFCTTVDGNFDSPMSTQESNWSLYETDDNRSSISSFASISYATKQTISRYSGSMAEVEIDRTSSNLSKISPPLDSASSHTLEQDKVLFVVYLSGSVFLPDVFTMTLSKLELVSIENICNWIFYKIILQHHILYDNVRLSVIYKNPAISPVVLKNYTTQKRTNLDRAKDELLLDYLNTKDKVYIKAEIRQ